MKFLAVLMIVLGFSIVALSGLCTATLSLAGLAMMFRSPPRVDLVGLVVPLVVGGPFIAGGVALLLGGLRLWERGPGKRDRDAP